MSNPNICKEIKELTSVIIDTATTDLESENCIHKIHSHLQKITQISGYDHSLENSAAIPAFKGSALGLNFAAQCLFDYKRTSKFLKAIIIAIKEAQKKHPNTPINLFYAGCGPYAPFLTLVAPLFKPEEIQFSLLEINKNSVISAKKLIDTLNLSSYVKDIYTADAITFKINNGSSFHVLISETLDALLYRECYVPILINLLPQFKKDIVLIPENVILDLSVVLNNKTNSDSEEINIDTIFNTKTSVSKNTNTILTELPSTKIDISSFDENLINRFIIDTKVHIYKDIWLSRNESSLSIPYEFSLEKPFKNKIAVFTYFLEPEIEMKISFE